MNRTRWLFGSAVFLASFLLFLVEPMAAKQLLPFLGGSAAVWITCLVFFQTALLVAYAYAHWLSRRPRSSVHLGVLAAAFALDLYWALGGLDLSNGSSHPVATIFFALSVWIGLPFLALGATSPLLQVWWSQIEGEGIPYRLFALSNLASLLALAAYPTLIEPNFTLRTQRIRWLAGFAFFAILSATLALRTRGAAVKTPATPDAPIQPAARFSSAPLRHKLLWLLLPMGASMQLSAVTSYITANIAPIPLLWILPLGVYLITIILAFEFPRLLTRGIIARLLVVMLAGLAYMLAQVDVTVPMRIGIGFFLAELLFACLFCHAEAYALRPQRTSESTVFYLLFAAGGALGSFLVGIAFPLIFSFNYDLAITFFITALLALVATWPSGWQQRLLWSAATVMMLMLTLWLNIAYQRGTTVAVRNFYGALRVKQSFNFSGAVLRTLTNGTIQHGTQIFGSDIQRKTPTSYYALDSGVGLALRSCCQNQPRNIGVIGLGAGTVAAYGQPGDRIRFYEINPAVAPIARNVFTYIRESDAQVSIVEGDARTSLAREAPQNFDVLIVDAFSGDAIPLHLLTAEALALYRRHLAPGGILAFHISNQHVDLEPAIALLAKSAGMKAMRVSSLANDERGEFPAYWVLVGDNADFFAQPQVAVAARAPILKPGLRLWTDDYSSLLPLLRW
ncbi:MAG: spermidine synthase [Terracidiphilus sp.]